MNTLREAALNDLDGLEGNKLFILLGIVIVWIVICMVINKKLNKKRNNKTTGVIGGIGLLLILGFWAVRFVH